MRGTAITKATGSPSGEHKQPVITMQGGGVLTKNLNYSFAQDYGFRDHDRFTEILRFADRVGGMSAVLECMQKVYHIQHGAQMFVDKEVSRDLAMTDMSHVQLDEIPFPQESLEFYFEDPELPTVLVYRGTMREFVEKLKIPATVIKEDSEDDADSINFWVESSSGPGMAFRARVSNWHEVVGDSKRCETLKGSISFSDEEWAQLRVIYQLIIKVLAYASIPYLAPREIGKKGLPRGHGKPGVKGRPSRPILRVVYLPEQSASHDGGVSHDGDSTKAFYGRRGHMRFYRSPRYKHMKGKFQYIAPVLGPNGEVPRTVYKVRKPKTQGVK
tara:strand:+ start:826 stop:1812 length:987 start_codon:yes stop_codon:yes gene_type:complete